YRDGDADHEAVDAGDVDLRRQKAAREQDQKNVGRGRGEMQQPFLDDEVEIRPGEVQEAFDDEESETQRHGEDGEQQEVDVAREQKNEEVVERHQKHDAEDQTE